MDDSKLGRVANVSTGRAAFQRDLDRQQKRVNRNHVMFSKGKCIPANGMG